MVTLEGIGKSFLTGNTSTRVLDDINLKLEPGEFFVLVGQSGSGKSTLLRCIAGLEHPDRGVIHIGSQVVYSAAAGINQPPEVRGIGMVFQSYAIWPHLSVEENITLPLTRGARRISKAQAHQEAQGVLDRLGLDGLARRPATTLSGGQQQRVALARALVSGAQIILMDEPLSNLDAALREQLREELKRILTEFGTTVLYVTHDRHEAFTLADRLGIIEHGRLLAVGTPLELYYKPNSKPVAEVLGPVNWLSGKVRDGRVTTLLGEWVNSKFDGIDGEALFGIRPERIRYLEEGESARVVFEATVAEAQFMGELQRIHLMVQGVALYAHRSPPVPLNSGQSYRFGLDAEDIFLVSVKEGQSPAEAVSQTDVV